MDYEEFGVPPEGRRKKKADREALLSGLMKIPRIDVATVRDLIDLGYREIDELRGRSPEVLFEELRARKPQAPADRLYSFRMAVYYAENDDPDPARLSPWAWRD